MLTQKQAHALQRAHRLNLFLNSDDNKTIVATYEPFAEEVDLFVANLERADSDAKGKAVKEDVTEEKKNLKRAASDSLGSICRKTKSYAIKINNPTLAAVMNVTADGIFKKKDEDIQAFYEAVVEQVTPLLTDAIYTKYGVKEQTLTDAGKQVAAFHDMIGKEGVDSSEYTVANTKIDADLKLIAGNVDQFDLLIEDFADDYPDFVKGYHINARLGDDVVRHSGIEGVVRDKKTGDLIKGAVIKLEDTTKVALSEITGEYRLAEVTPGYYYVVVTAVGYDEARVLHRILKGEIEEMNFEL